MQDEWVVTIVQLIALFYKDQHVENMQKLLGSWLNNTTSDSSEDDDESNTSPSVTVTFCPANGFKSVAFFSAGPGGIHFASSSCPPSCNSCLS